MFRVAFLAVVLLGAQDTTVFKDDQLRLAFSYPKSWTVGKKSKDFTTLVIPIEGSEDKARLEITRALFHSDPDIWQTVQLDANKQLKREVVRQWQEEILGVPMLLTQIRYTDKGVPTSTLTGLLYTRTTTKLLFRLTGPDADFDKVQFEFQNAIQTLRTMGDATLTAEDPSKPPVKPDKTPPEKVDLRPPKKVTFTDPPKKAAIVQGPVVVEIEVATRKMQARMPSGWTFDGIEEHKFVAHHSQLANPVTVEVFSLLDSDPPNTVLFKRSSDSLNEFQKVAKRSDVADRVTRSGMTETAIWRTGDATDGSHFTLDATLTNDTHYICVAYRSSKDADRRWLEELLNVLSVAPTP